MGTGYNSVDLYQIKAIQVPGVVGHVHRLNSH